MKEDLKAIMVSLIEALDCIKDNPMDVAYVVGYNVARIEYLIEQLENQDNQRHGS